MPPWLRQVGAGLLCAATLAGCGAAASGPSGGPMTLALDFAPNAVHAGIYLALARDFDSGEGIELSLRVPGASTEPIDDLRTGRADLAVMDIHDLALARERGEDLVGVMALVQTPLAAILADPSVRSPRRLEGRRVGVTGAASDVAVLRSIVEGDGGDAARVRRVPIGFEAVPALLGRRVDAITAFWNAEGVALAARGTGVREFRVERYGAPTYPELVVVAPRATVQDRREAVEGVVRTLRRGYEEALLDPPAAVGALTEAEPSLQRALVRQALDAVIPSLRSGVRRYGQLDVDRLQAWARWARRMRIVRRTPDVGLAFDAGLAR